MVTANRFCLVFVFFVPGVLSWPQDAPATTVLPTVTGTDGSNDNLYGYEAYDYETQYGDYGKQYDDYGKQYDDYVKQYGDYIQQYGDYGKQYGDYGKPNGDDGKQYVDYGPVYSDYGASYGDYGPAYGDYGEDFGDYHTHAYDYGYFDDYEHDYGDYFGYGDRNNPTDTMMKLYDETGLGSNVPWVYIIVPVVQIDVFYIDEGDKGGMEDIQMQLPIETFFFELGDFGMGHLDLSNFIEDTSRSNDYVYDDYSEKEYPQYDVKSDLYDTADELTGMVLDYPGIDHEPFWMDWIFMIPPDEIIR